MAQRRWPLAVALCTALAVAPGASAQQTAAVASLAPTVSDIRIGRMGTTTRVVLYLSGETDVVHDLSPDRTAVFIAFEAIRWTVPRTFRRTRGIVTGYVFKAEPGGGGSLVLSTADPVRIERVSLRPPNGAHGHRIILDLVDGEAPEAGDAADGASASARGPRAVATFRGEPKVGLRTIAARYRAAAVPRRQSAAAGGRDEVPLAEEREERRQDTDPEAAPDGTWKPRLERFGSGPPPSDEAGEEPGAPVIRAPTRQENEAIQEMLRRRQAEKPAELAPPVARTGGTYVSVDVGLSFGDNVAAKVSGSRFEASGFTGFRAQGAAGYGWASGLRAEGEVSYDKANLETLRVIDPGTVPGLGSGVFAAEGRVSSVALMANLAYDVDTGTWFSPFLLGGIGGARVALEGVRAGTVAIPDASDWKLAYQAGAGASVAAGQWSMRLGYRYVGTAGGGVVDSDGGRHAFTLGAAYRF